MSVFVSKSWPSCVYSVSLVVRGSLLHLYPIILYLLLTLRLERSQYNRCLAGYQTERVLSLVGFFSFSLVDLLPSLALRHLDLAAAVSDSNTVYVVWFAWPAPPACIAPMLTYKNISFRGNLASFSCRRVSSPPEFLCVWHMYFLCHPVFYFEFTNVTLFTWCFSFILDQSQRKRLPFSGIIPYAQAPKGFHLFWLLCFLKHPFPMG